MGTEDHRRWDAHDISWINLIQSNTTHCAELGLRRAQESYVDTGAGKLRWYRSSDLQHTATHSVLQCVAVCCSVLSDTAQVTAPGLFGGFSFRGLENSRGGVYESTPQPRGKNTVERNSERRIPRKSSESRRLFTGANLVVRLALLDVK